MAVFTSLWAYDSFRLALKALIDQTPETLLAFAAATASEFHVSAEQLPSAVRDDAEAHIAVLETVYFAARRAGVSGPGVVKELRDRLPGAAEFEGFDLEDREDALTELFGERPELEARRARRIVEQGLLPSAINFSIGLDVRVDVQEGDVRLIPILLAQVELREPNQSSNSISFQFTEEGLADLRAEIDQAVDTLELARNSLSEHWIDK